MVRIIIHRGGHEIGGSAVEIRSTGGRILLDLGAPLDFDTRAAADIDALRQRGVLQRIQGLYADDTPSFDAILLSHAHLDHSGLLPFAHPDIPLALSSGSRALMELGTRFLKYPVLPNRQVIFEMYRTFSIADMEITPYLIDHSAFDAAAFEIFTDGRRIVYTGDFRCHGRKAASFERFMRRVTPAPDVLLCEGTTLGRTDAPAQTETELEQEIAERLKRTNGIALFQCASQNIDRLVTFCRAAQRAGRIMVIDRYTAATLAELHKLGNKLPTAGRHPNLSIRRPMDAQKTLMLVRPSMLAELSADDTIRSGVFFYSLWNGYRSQPGQMELEKFLVGRGVELVEAHTSGHADTHTLRLLLERLKPKQIIPIHTLSPEHFREFSDRVRVVQDGEIVEC